MSRIAYLGTGLMGSPMALRLVGAGHEVTVWNRSPEKTAPAVEAGATRADTPAEAVQGADAVMCCLMNAKAVEAVVFGPDGVASAPGAPILIDFSSMDPELTKTYGARLRDETGMGWIDAPVSGSTPAATNGTLTIMAGGTAEDFAAARPLMDPLAARVTHMGPAGAGQMTKLVNQIISGCTMTIVAEAVAYAQAKGVDASLLTEALAGGFADSRPFQLFAPRMAARHFEDPLGTVGTMLKDLDTVSAVGGNAVHLPMTDTARAVMRKAGEMGHMDEDISTIVLAMVAAQNG